MRKNIFVGILFVSLLLYSNGLFDKFDKKRRMLFDVIFKKYDIRVAKILTDIYDALIKLNLPINTIKLALSQVLHETGVFGSGQRASKVNNFSGITYSGSAAQLATGAKRSEIALPSKEQPKVGPKIYYAAYPDVSSWAKDYLRQLKKGTMPIMASSPQDFAIRLKQNKYYTDSIENYSRNITFYYNLINKAI